MTRDAKGLIPAMLLLSITVLVLAGSATAGPNLTPGDLVAYGRGEAVAGEVIVKFKPHVSQAAIDALTRANNTSVLYRSPFAGFMRLRVPQGRTMAQMIAAYRARPEVEYAEPNYVRYALMVPNDPYFSYQWHLSAINAEAAWDISTGAGVVVAVVDTGIAYEDYIETIFGIPLLDYYQAPDLANTTFVAGYDFINDDTHPNDDQGHGTHVAGTIAQSTNNAIGVAGVAFGASLMPVKVLNMLGMGSDADVADGIWYAADHGAKVINLSLGAPESSTTLENACAHAYNAGVTVVCAAGNEGDGQNRTSYPAAYDAYCIAVAATRYDGTRAYYSNYGSYVDVAAPGGDLNVDQNGDGYGDGVLQNTFNPNTGDTSDFGYWFFQGTSMATPHVVGAAALLIANGVTEPDAVRAALEQTAVDKGATGWDPQYGWGLIDAYAALTYGGSPPPPPPPPPAKTLHIASITMALKITRSGATASATVKITDADNARISGATVSGHWSDATNDTDSGTTRRNGTVTLTSDRVKKPASGTTFTFTVDDVSAAGWTYDSAANAETSDSITTP
jgi:serine protease